MHYICYIAQSATIHCTECNDLKKDNKDFSLCYTVAESNLEYFWHAHHNQDVKKSLRIYSKNRRTNQEFSPICLEMVDNPGSGCYSISILSREVE